MILLGIESSCDESAAALVQNGRRVLSSAVATQPVHGKFSGVVPELASRAHVQSINGVIEQALKKASVSWNRIDGLAVTTGPGLARPLLDLDGQLEGAVSADGKVGGCYLHGLFASDAFRAAFLVSLRDRAASGLAYEAQVEATLDALAAHLEAHLDLDRLLAIARAGGQPGNEAVAHFPLPRSRQAP